ncbi:lysylphosphatidylglycerol synthase transmembrane domain-containing protein [Parabacteroides leei]|uniref:lysylphosphatidylglycerol synthase transmembrane domain-containing protein n=1 Tax=Parabacteroides leei TaxID=2939491 RepID=UPI00189909D1|nr:lysylphosphatidylglycerol synthase transmembrane domain-containing protein [Parabacteroides goldsteinii]
MNFKSILQTFVKIFLPLAFGCLLLWFLYSNMDVTEIWRVIREGVRYDIILVSLLFGLFANVVRGLRWGLLISSLGERFKMSNIIYAVLGNYAVNMVLPRVGEVWRCGIITKYDKIPFTKLLGTLLIDRVSDTIVVGSITLLIFIFNFDFFVSFFARNPVLLDGFRTMFDSIWIYVGAVILVGGIWFVFKYMSNFTLVQKAKSLLLNVWDGMKSIWLLKQKGRFLLQTLLIWGGYFCYFYITFYAFDFTRDLGITVGLIAFTMSSIGVAVPVQAGIGAWHFMVIATLVCFGVNENDAAAFALVVHTVQTAWTVICGLFGIVALPLTNRDNKVELAVDK